MWTQLVFMHSTRVCLSALTIYMGNRRSVEASIEKNMAMRTRLGLLVLLQSGRCRRPFCLCSRAVSSLHLCTSDKQHHFPTAHAINLVIPGLQKEARGSLLRPRSRVGWQKSAAKSGTCPCFGSIKAALAHFRSLSSHAGGKQNSAHEPRICSR